MVTYRDWTNAAYFESGAQYFYGPIFHALGENVAWLRIVRLGMALGANFWFAWAFVSWLSKIRGASITQVGRRALVLLILAAGAPAYMFTPLTPGYYDLTVDITLCFGAIVCLTASKVHGIERPSTMLAFTTGLLAFIVIVAKWPAVITVFAAEVVLLILVRGCGRWAMLQHLLGFAAGFGVALLGMDWFMEPVPDVFRVLSLVMGTRTGAEGGLRALLAWYLIDTSYTLFLGGLFAAPTALLLLVTTAKRFKMPERSRAWRIAAVVVPTASLLFFAGWRGGTPHGKAPIAAMIGALLTIVVIGFLNSDLSRVRNAFATRETRNSTVLLIALLALPVLQALGASSPILYLGLECMAMWMAVSITLATGSFNRPLLRDTVWTCICSTIVIASTFAGSTAMLTPFKTSGFKESTSQIPGIPELRVDDVAASQFQAVTRVLAPFIQPGSRTPFYTLDELSGLVYILGGRVIGTPYTNASAPNRSAAILALACRRGDVDSSRPPILLLNRAIDQESSSALMECGFAFPAKYREISIPGGPRGLTAWVPRRT